MQREHPEPSVFAAPCAVGESCGGLGVFATSFIPKGSVILVEEPFALTPAWRTRKTTCAACLADLGGGQRADSCACVACGTIFCSEACQRQSNAHSDIECEALASFERALSEDASSERFADLVLQAIRILSHRHAARNLRPFGDDSPTEVQYESYAARLQPMKRSKRTGEAIKAAVIAALQAVPLPARVPPGELFEVLNRHQCNAIGILGAGNSSIGLASFLGGAHIFNHDCLPNIAFDCRPHERAKDGTSPRFCFRALVDVPQGAELCHCYAGSGEGPAQRQQYLLDHRGFRCTCARCTCDDIMEEAAMADGLDAMRCRSDNCGTGLGYPVAPGCRKCIQCGEMWEHDDDE